MWKIAGRRQLRQLPLSPATTGARDDDLAFTDHSCRNPLFGKCIGESSFLGSLRMTDFDKSLSHRWPFVAVIADVSVALEIDCYETSQMPYMIAWVALLPRFSCHSLTFFVKNGLGRLTWDPVSTERKIIIICYKLFPLCKKLIPAAFWANHSWRWMLSGWILSSTGCLLLISSDAVVSSFPNGATDVWQKIFVISAESEIQPIWFAFRLLHKSHL